MGRGFSTMDSGIFLYKELCDALEFEIVIYESVVVISGIND